VAGSERSAVRRPDLDSLYCINPDGSRNAIHPADVRGRYQRRKRALWTLLIGVYLAVPWIELGGRPLILIDIGRRRFELLGAAFDAQDFYLAFFLLSGVGFALFVVSALFGRVWCGYGCPHTVFLDGVYRRIERWLEGGAAQRKSLRAAPWLGRKLPLKLAKWAAYLAVSFVLAHTLLGYFMPVREVFAAVTGPPAAHPTAFAFVSALTALVYFDMAWFREQLCIVICPYGRLQGVLSDRDTIHVAYDPGRGEPRGKYTDGARGDCIDCFRCVAVCPTGIDIRNGTQLECIGCANCIDACDEVMRKVGQAPGLIRYDSQAGIELGRRRLLRPRLFLYLALVALGAGVFGIAATARTTFVATVVRQQGAPYTVIEGGVRNSFFVHLVNKGSTEVAYELALEAPPGVDVLLPVTRVSVPAFEDRRLPFFVTAAPDALVEDLALELSVRAPDSQQRVRVPFLGPPR
jgi:cytochrome c oxidase accessory protein FixG